MNIFNKIKKFFDTPIVIARFNIYTYTRDDVEYQCWDEVCWDWCWCVPRYEKFWYDGMHYNLYLGFGAFQMYGMDDFTEKRILNKINK